MSAGPRKIFLAVLWLAGGALFAVDYEYSVDMVTGADADIRLTVPGGQMPRAGFLPVRVRVNNRSHSERSWRLELGSTMGGTRRGFQSGAQLNWAGSLAVPGGSTREFFLFVPVMSGQAGRPAGIQASLDGPQVARSGFALGLDQGWGSSRAPLAVEPGLEAPLNDILVAQASAGSAAVSAAVAASGRPVYRMPRGAPMANIGVIDPALWPADWRLWSSFSTVLLDQSTWERLDTARRRALLDYVALGGRLVRVNSIASRERLGAGLIVTLPGPMSPDAEGLLEVLGQVASRPNEPALLVNEDFWNLSPAPWQLSGQHRWLTGCIIVFGLLIGPVNLFYFAPAGRRHRLFLTVPVISVASALLLFGSITIKDGFGGAGTRRGVVVLQPAQNQAVVFQQQISRTGLLAGRKFSLPADTTMDLDADGTEGTGASQQLWREGDGADGDWFTSRSVKLHSLRRLVPTRERVELVGAAGSAPVVQSTVGGTLRDFLFVDPAGKMWTAAEVPPGTRVTLVAGVTPGQRDISDIIIRYLSTQNTARGAFYARGDAGGLIPTLPSIRWRDDLVLYTGQLNPVTEAAP